MNRLIQRYHNMRFRNKMILSDFVIALIPLLIFSAVLGRQLVKDANETSRSHMVQMVGQMSEAIDVYIGTVDKQVDYVVHMVETDMLSPHADPEHMEEMLDSMMDAYPEVAGILIAYSNDQYISAGMTRISRDPFVEEPWFQTALDREGQLGIIGTAVGRNVVTNTTYSMDKIFSVVKRFRVSGGVEGVVLIDIRHDIIEQLIDSISIGNDGFLYIADSLGDVVYTPTNPLVYRIDNECFTDTTDTTNVSIGAENYWVSSHFSDYTGWRSVGVLSEAEYSASTTQIYWILSLCIVLCIVLVVVLSMKLSETVTRPLFALQRLMKMVEGGDFSVRFHSDYADEIGQLGDSFNRMLERSNTLIQELYVEKQARLEAQLKTLQEQIKPHFLYNTLDTISWMARMHGADDVVKLVDALTNMFRVGLSRGKDFIPLKDEKRHVRNYLYIQKTRYCDKLGYEISIPEELDNVTVPKLILQPLVENAIYHGIKLKPGGGTITISGYQEGRDLTLSVHDNGAGVPPERLALIQKQLGEPGGVDTKVGFGLFYIAERIALCYGKEYGVTIESAEGEGTTVTIRIPMEDKRNV